MKNTIRAFAAGVASAAILAGHVFGQSASNQADVARSQTTNASSSAPVTTPLKATTASKFELRAIKDFKGRFAKAGLEEWYAVDKGYAVTFVEDGFKGRAYYDKRGDWKYSILYVDENKIPRDIRAVVKRTYYDFKITLVQVIETPEHMIYLVHLEDATSLKIVRVSPEGEMDVYQDLTKS